MEKSADAFRTISEVADDLDLPQHVLRFWETRFQQIRPLKRAGGRRYYRPADLVVLRAIRQLLYDEGYTIKGVQRLLKEQGIRNVGAGQAAIEPTLGGPALDSDDAPAFFEQAIGERPEPASSSITDIIKGGEPVDPPPAPADEPSAIREALGLIEACEAILASVRRS